MQKIYAAIALLLLMPTQAFAADANGQFSVRGLGGTKCSELIKVVGEQDNDGLRLYSAWFAGYATASHRFMDNIFEVYPTTRASDIVGLVAVVCQTQPESLVETASKRVIDTLSPMHQANETPLVRFTNGEGSVSVRQGASQQLAVVLAQKGLYSGDTSGEPNPEFRRAIASFQTREGLIPTGLPDVDVFIRLLLSQ